MGRLESQIGPSGSGKFIPSRTTVANDLGKGASIFDKIWIDLLPPHGRDNSIFYQTKYSFSFGPILLPFFQVGGDVFWILCS